MTDFIDPLGGSYAVEYLTDALEAAAEAILGKVDALGGMVEAIAQGYPQEEIQDASYQAQRALEEKQAVVVGVNAFTQEEPPPKNLLRVNEEVERAQGEQLKGLRAARSTAAVTRCLDALRRAAASEKENLVPLILEAVKAHTTLGEISDALRDVFGEHREHVVL